MVSNPLIDDTLHQHCNFQLLIIRISCIIDMAIRTLCTFLILSFEIHQQQHIRAQRIRLVSIVDFLPIEIMHKFLDAADLLKFCK